MTKPIRSTSRPLAATSVATKILIDPCLNLSTVRSLWFWGISPFKTATLYPYDSNFSATTIVMAFVLANIITPSSDTASSTLWSALTL